MWWIFFVILLVLLIVYLILISPRLIGRPPMTLLYVDYAHRGWYGGDIPENSLPAFARAVAHRYGIELDVQLSSDEVIMVFHDDTLARMTGAEGRLCERTCAQLQQLRLGESEEIIPTLDQVLEVVDGRVPLLIELKGESAGGDARLCEKLAERLEDYAGAYCLESFNPMILAWFRRYRPAMVRGQLVTNTLRERPKGNRLLNFLLAHLMLNVLSRPDFVAYDGRYAGECSLWLNRHLFRARSFVWTVRDADVWKRENEKQNRTIFEGFLLPQDDPCKGE